MEPVAAPPLADKGIVAVNATPEAQLEKSIVTFPVALPPGAILPTISGNEVLIAGVQAVPRVWVRVRLVSCALTAAPGPLFPTVNGQTRAFVGPDFRPIEPPSEVPPALAKFAVTVSGAVIVTVVLALFALAAGPVQFENAYPEFAVAPRLTTVPDA
jgi:hypothetical protein